MTADEHPLTIAFDADDTLWHNENLFLEVHNGHEIEVPTLEALRDLPQLLKNWAPGGELDAGMAGPAGTGGRYGVHPA